MSWCLLRKRLSCLLSPPMGRSCSSCSGWASMWTGWKSRSREALFVLAAGTGPTCIGFSSDGVPEAGGLQTEHVVPKARAFGQTRWAMVAGEQGPNGAQALDRGCPPGPAPHPVSLANTSLSVAAATGATPPFPCPQPPQTRSLFCLLFVHVHLCLSLWDHLSM